MTTGTLDTSQNKPPSRGPHGERTAAMRQRLILAAISCLQRYGYAATTTQLVVETAKVSRGAILHHFRTKVDLMLAIAEQAADNQNLYVAERLQAFEPGMPRFLALTDATWEVMRQPAAQALLEIMMASRSDAHLALRLAPVVKRLEDDQRDGVWRLAESIGIRDRDTVQAMVRLHIAAMRGLALERNLTGNEPDAEAGIALLHRHKRGALGELLLGGNGQDTPSSEG